MPKRAETMRARRCRAASAEVCETVKKYRQKLAIAGRTWEKAAEILDGLLAVAELKPGRRLSIGEGQYVEIVDLFASSNKVFKPTAFERYQLQILDAAGKQIRLRDRKKTAKPKKA